MRKHINREEIDKDSNRYFFVKDPVEVASFKKEVKLKVHPDKKKTRTVKVSKVYVEKEDFSKYKGKNVRLKGLANVILGKGRAETKDTQTIHWVSKPQCRVEVLMPDNKWIKGIGEPSIAKVKVGKIVQFERFGFVRCAGKSRFIYGHR